ncbi:DivIVA domain-containing protein [Branchiibius hedensis]|uniref:DivIVA domain-containing protein n=1 Tax=Branchiibius hedensis TaxID=672460 RepID=A0A2Y9C2H7_9MICO|nr:DivIVA domain-containing protein [Branchiibius hedensis]PWJ27292.1 DivIVA domain-containing protein [Branchiibius hedensis]SSA36103.1 DivIVA domain-containing protein [Branchiibius hedensis]
MPSLLWPPDQIAAVRSAVFPPERGGYVRDDVERQLDRIALTMERGGPLPDLAGTAIRRVPLASGLAVDSVDGFLRQVYLWQQDLLHREPEASVRTPEGGAGRSARVRWTPAQQDWVRDSRFAIRTGKRAYVEHEVDDFLDKVLVAMARGDDLPDIDTVLFYPPRRTGRGYDALQVDAFLDQLARLRPLHDHVDRADI